MRMKLMPALRRVAEVHVHPAVRVLHATEPFCVKKVFVVVSQALHVPISLSVVRHLGATVGGVVSTSVASVRMQQSAVRVPYVQTACASVRIPAAHGGRRVARGIFVLQAIHALAECALRAGPVIKCVAQVRCAKPDSHVQAGCACVPPRVAV
jgi:hypothetical protein